MIDPFTVLGVPVDADDQTIRQAYLDQVRRYPADRHPGRFQRIRVAYEQIQGRRERLGHRLFDVEAPTPDALLEHLDEAATPRRPSLEQFQALLRMPSTGGTRGGR